MDHGIRKIFIYDRIGRIEFKRVKEVSCWKAGTDIKLIDDKLFIAGYAADQNGNKYHFYYIDITNDQKTFLLPSYMKFGFKSRQDFEAQFRENMRVGIGSWFDIHENQAYFVWEGNLKVIKLNIETGYIDPEPFGTKPPHYLKPHLSAALHQLILNNDSKLIEKEKVKIMSYVRDVISTSKYILVIYEGPAGNENGSNYFKLQFYTLDGNFINEVSIPDQPDRKMWFDKDRDILYSLSIQSNTVGNEGYFLLKYKIYE